MNIRMHGLNLHVRCFADIVSATRGTRPLPLDPLPSSLFQGTAEHRIYHDQSLSQNRPTKFHLISVPRRLHPCRADLLFTGRQPDYARFPPYSNLAENRDPGDSRTGRPGVDRLAVGR